MLGSATGWYRGPRFLAGSTMLWPGGRQKVGYLWSNQQFEPSGNSRYRSQDLGKFILSFFTKIVKTPMTSDN